MCEDQQLVRVGTDVSSRFVTPSPPPTHGLINYIDTRAKYRHVGKLTSKGILRQVFIRVYRLEIQSVMLVFSTQLCELLPLSPSLKKKKKKKN
jgi:hypothetical protein